MANVYEISRKLLETAFKTYWEAITPALPPIQFENAPFAQPAAGEWIRFTVRFGSGQQASLGSTPLEFQNGQVIVQIFTPKNGGSRRAAVLADLVAAGLRYRQMNDATTGVVVDAFAPEMVPVGERSDSYQENVRVTFRAQHIAAVAA
jgi:hypothetical protein